MVQMKGDYNMTHTAPQKKLFISHMVQMKARRPGSSSTPIIALYPTWFR